MLNYVFPKISHETMVSFINNGLPKTTIPKKIIVIGAGMSGLVSASLLKEAGHNVSVLEAANRVGGRVYTLRDNFVFNQYIEAGAMRFPDIQKLVFEYIRKFNLPLNEFINSTPNDIYFINGIKTTSSVYEENPDIFGFNLAPKERGKTAYELVELAVKPVVDFIEKNPVKNWPIVIKELDKYSMSSYLRYNPYGFTLSTGAIEMIESVLTLEGTLQLSILEHLRDIVLLFDPDMKFYEITGGNDQLPKAFLKQLSNDIYFGQYVKKIIQHDNYITIQSNNKELGPFSISGDLVIVTIPFSVLQFVQVEPYDLFSSYKRRAIREFNYAASTKTGIQFQNRFWEKQGLYGGQTVTDLPIKYAQYPSSNIGIESPGVVLGSYTWDNDAYPWDSLDRLNRIEYVMKDLATIHGQEVYSNYITGDSFSWLRNPYSAGAFTMLEPNQITELVPYVSIPEGRVHFAGEHTATLHGWVEGAIESGVRVASEVNNLPKTYFK